MKIPRKITPDCLKDTIVQILFESEYSPELILGLFQTHFSEDFKFIGNTISPNREGKKYIIKESQQGYFVDNSENIKINITSNQITFNSLSHYQGWSKFYSIIQLVVKGLVERKIIVKVNRVGIRYISQFDNISIFDKTKINIDTPYDNDLVQSQFRTQFYSDEYEVILTLLNSVTDNNSEIPASIIDVDVIKQFDNDNSLNETVDVIDSIHLKQKEVFFKLLEDNFLNSLNPEY